MKIAWLCLSLIVAEPTMSQVKIRSINLKEGTSSWLSYSFPFIYHSNPAVAKKINAYLQKDILDNSRIETSPKKLFQNSGYINNDSIRQSGYSEISFEVEVNTSRI